ncbi:MAG: Gfo/Idh/MocA family oxidoreductase [Caldilinea sp.]|nr:Gfo/Idh/MocA family oxidoreductase [Caldilinea sp.]
MIRACVIGLGPIGNRHAGLLKTDPLAELVGLCDLDPSRADAAAARFGAPAFYSVDQMLAALAPDLCVVATGVRIMNPRESSPYFQIKALHPHTVDIMRHFCGEVEAVQCFATKAPGRTIWSTATFNMRFKNGVVGTLTGSYDIERGHPMERCEVAGTRGRFVIEDMYREATLFPAGDMERRVFVNPIFGGMRDFEETFLNRQHRFLEQLSEGAAPEEIDGSGADGLAAQKVLAAAIESLENETVVYVK